MEVRPDLDRSITAVGDLKFDSFSISVDDYWTGSSYLNCAWSDKVDFMRDGRELVFVWQREERSI